MGHRIGCHHLSHPPCRGVFGPKADALLCTQQRAPHSQRLVVVNKTVDRLPFLAAQIARARER